MTFANKLVITVGEHPDEVTALYLGRKVAEELERRGYDVSVERMPLELTRVGSIVKGLPLVDITGHAMHFSWLENIHLQYGNEVRYLHFHNCYIYGNPLNLRDILFLDANLPTGGAGIEIPAIPKQTKNKRLLKGALKPEDATVADFKSSSEHGLVDLILPRLVQSIEDYINGRLLPVELPRDIKPTYKFNIADGIVDQSNPFSRL